MSDKKILRVTRTATWSVDTIWPDHYDGDSVADAAKYEKEIEFGAIVESLSYSPDAKFVTEVEVLDEESRTVEQDGEVRQ